MKKKLCVAMLVAASLLVMTACGSKKEETKAETKAETTTEATTAETKAETTEETTAAETVEMVEVAGPEAFDEMGIKLQAPEETTDVKYCIIGEIAQVEFKLADIDFVGAAVKSPENVIDAVMSVDGIEKLTTHVVGIDTDTTEATIFKDEEGNTCAVWYWDEAQVQYTIYTTSDIDVEDFTAVVMAFADANLPQ